MSFYALPDGTSTTSVKTYIAAWRAIGEPIAKALDASLIAWDPDLLFRRASGKTFELPIDIAVALSRIIAGAESKAQPQATVDASNESTEARRTEMKGKAAELHYTGR